MLRIRHFESRVVELYKAGKIRGASHVYLGQEAVAAGVCSELRREDYITSTHRGHGHCIAKGGALSRMMAELLGRWDGYCHGKGGSMHIAELELGILGANGIVGAGIPLAVGAALTAQKQKSGQVAVSFFGDGATATGAFHEGLNLAAVWKLPVIFVCENNQYGQFTPWMKVSPVDAVTKRAVAYGMPGVSVDGNDVFQVIHQMRVAVERARAGLGPTLIEARTYRWGGHHIGDAEEYRSKEEVAAWKAEDPIPRFIGAATSLGLLTLAEAEQVEKEVSSEVEEAVRFAMASPEPPIESATDGVYAPTPALPVPPLPRNEERELTYRDALNEALREEMVRDERVVLWGEDVAAHGGVFQVTKRLFMEFGPERVRDTPISEDAIVGAAVGAALTGLRPVCEIMYLNFLTISMNALVNQGAKIRYMFGGKATLPLVVRTQSGVGTARAAQHSDNWEAWFHHVPGLKVVVASTPYDAKGLLKAAIRDDNPVVFIERTRLYNQKGPVPPEEYVIPLGKARIHREGSDLTLIVWGAILQEALEAAAQLAKEGISVEVIDPRTLFPLDHEAILNSVRKTGRAVIVHEAPLRGGVGAEISALIMEQAFDSLEAPVVRVGGKDAPIPFAENLEKSVIPQAADILAACRKFF
jgi:pyruvate/2-oxoglutarate/acetoin dehydrogenase E1 component/TPP-dependent pyruvate/acetoin dehydrogenase alpha subunit